MSLQKHYRETLLHVVGQALSAAGYALEESPLHWSDGLFRFRRWHSGMILFVDYQLLIYAEDPSRFCVRLKRQPDPAAGEDAPAFEAGPITLSRLLWDVVGVRVLLSGPDHWWTFRDTQTLGDGLVESGKLLVGYGLPWLDESLIPDADSGG